MRVVLLTQPGRGDVEPFIALALRLKQHGYDVTVASRPDFAGLVGQYGVRFAPVGNRYQPFVADAAKAGAVGSGHPWNKLRYGLRQRRYVTQGLHESAWRAAQGADAVIYKYPQPTGYTIADKLSVPCAAVLLLPLVPTREFPSFMLGRGIDRGRLVNRLVWQLPWQAVWQGLRLDDTKFRRQLGLPPLPLRGPLPGQREGMPLLCAWSPAVLPRPADWPANVHVTGYWPLGPPPGWQPPAGLAAFLGEGPPPVSVGFGSMVSADPQATLRVVLNALEQSAQRGVLLSGWAGLGGGKALPSSVFRAVDIPHSWLFPRMAAVVHHGGAGTTGAALRAGVPSVICPFAADQPSWARVVHELGAGSAPIPFPALTARRLATAVAEAVGNPAIREHAAEIGRTVRSEDGIGRAVELFSQYAERFHKRS